MACVGNGVGVGAAPLSARVLREKAIRDPLRVHQGPARATPPVEHPLRRNGHRDLLRGFGPQVQPHRCMDPEQLASGDPLLQKLVEGGPDPAAGPDHPDPPGRDRPVLQKEVAEALVVVFVPPRDQEDVGPLRRRDPGEGVPEVDAGHPMCVGEGFGDGKVRSVVGHGDPPAQEGRQFVDRTGQVAGAHDEEARGWPMALEEEVLSAGSLQLCGVGAGLTGGQEEVGLLVGAMVGAG
ncbi:MAG: hypothetical protein EA352_07275 [Gemmatimonadales bacterium]|nr:MAG: hypothetical protein EA352_07275 [Gemmatimonadales bacterium]